MTDWSAPLFSKPQMPGAITVPHGTKALYRQARRNSTNIWKNTLNCFSLSGEPFMSQTLAAVAYGAVVPKYRLHPCNISFAVFPVFCAINLIAVPIPCSFLRNGKLQSVSGSQAGMDSWAAGCTHSWPVHIPSVQRGKCPPAKRYGVRIRAESRIVPEKYRKKAKMWKISQKYGKNLDRTLVL